MKQSEVLIKGEETMTNIEKVNKALKNADESKIKEVLDFLGYKEDSKFIPESGDEYWFINMEGEVYFYSWHGTRFDNRQLLMGNVYQTEEEAEQALSLQTRNDKLIKEIEGSLYQDSHKVQGSLHQHSQEVKGDLYNRNNKYGGELYEEPSTKLLKEVTLEELSELGYTLKGE